MNYQLLIIELAPLLDEQEIEKFSAMMFENMIYK